MDVVVIGGGIVGVASAYYLADRGATVTLLEKGTLGGGSTERSAGGIRTQFSTPVNVDLSLHSIEVWEEFDEWFGTGIAFQQAGYLFLARKAETADAFRENVAMQNERGADSRLLDPVAATEYCPGLRPDSFEVATYASNEGYADPHLALQGFAEAAREAGAEIHTRRPATGLRTSPNRQRVIGVDTPEGPLDADYVVNAAGPWSGPIAEMADVDLPVAPKRRSIAIVEPETPIRGTVGITIDLDRGSYFRSEREGNALVGGKFDGDDPTQDPDRYAKGMEVEWAVEAVERAADYAEYFGPESRIRGGWSGLYTVTPDHHPIIEESVEGLVTATGFSGHGFQHAPATGMIVTELVFEGEASLVDISPLRRRRFEEGDGHTEQNVA